MSGFSTTFPTSFKGELPIARHDFTASTGHVFKCALGKGTVVGTYDSDTTNYSDLTGNSDEVPNGSGYVTGGFAWTAAQNITPQIDGPTRTAFWSWAANPQWVAATLSTSGCLIYDVTDGNSCVYTGSFGGVKSIVSAMLTLILPANSPGASILGLD